MFFSLLQLSHPFKGLRKTWMNNHDCEATAQDAFFKMSSESAEAWWYADIWCCANNSCTQHGPLFLPIAHTKLLCGRPAFSEKVLIHQIDVQQNPSPICYHKLQIPSSQQPSACVKTRSLTQGNTICLIKTMVPSLKPSVWKTKDNKRRALQTYGRQLKYVWEKQTTLCSLLWWSTSSDKKGTLVVLRL